MTKARIFIFLVIGWFLLSSAGQANSLPHVSEAEDLSMRTTFVDALSSAILISEADFKEALAKFAFHQVEPQLRERAIDFTATANEVNTRGIIGLYSQRHTTQPFSGHIFVVARDPLMSRDGKLVQTTQYYVAAVELSGEAKWIGTNTRFAIDDTIAVNRSGRCCGPEILAINNPKPIDTTPFVDPTPPCDPGPYFCGDIYRGVTDVPPPNLESRLRAGLPLIGLELYPTKPTGIVPSLPDIGSEGFKTQSFRSVHRVVDRTDPTCAYIKPVCDEGDVGFTRDRGGSADLPSGSTTCQSPPTSRTVYFQDIPKICTIINQGEQAPTITKMGGRPILPLTCGGVCIGLCNETSQPASNWLPPGCAMMDPVEGSSICKTPTQQEQEETLKHLQAIARYTGGAGVSRTCQPASRYGKICTECDKDGCRQVPIRYPVGGSPDIAASEPAKEKEISRNEKIDKRKADCNGNQKCEAYWEQCRADVNDTTCLNSTFVSAKRDVKDEGKKSQPSSSPPSTPATGGGGVPPPEKDKKKAKKTKPEDGPFVPGHGGRESPDPQKTTQQNPSKEGDPVVIGTGALSHLETDLSFDGPVRPFAFRRIYDSQSEERSTLGSNWRHNWDQTIVPLNIETTPTWALPYCAGSSTTTTCLVFRNETGGQTLFFLDMGSGLFMPQAGSTDTILRSENATWALRRKDGHELYFNKEGYLISDVDRFGNGFRVEYEPTPLYLLFQRFCGPDVIGSRTLHHRQCAVLAYLMGEIARPDINHEGWRVSAVDFPLQDSSTDRDLIYARSYFLHILSLGRGVQNVYGSARLRPLRVMDDLRRTLQFSYERGDLVSYTARDGKEYDFSKKPNAELLQSITGPGGSQLNFSYDRPSSHPQRLNEMFLTKVERKDAPETVDLLPAPNRKTEYRYQWSQNLSLSYDMHAKLVRTRYQAYYETFVGCWLQRQHCPGELYLPEKAPGDPEDLALHQAEGYLSEVADNLIEVINNGVTTLESRYEIDPLSKSFDKVLDQRYGSSFAQQNPKLILRDSPSDQWRTRLPKASYRYYSSGPVVGGGDATDEFLPNTLRQRYPIEHSNLKLEASVSCEPAVGAARRKNKVSCDYDKMKKLIKDLPGYQETLQYFPPLEKEIHPNLHGSLYRSRLICAQLAMSQISDPTHNDLLSDLVPVLTTKDTTDHVAKRIAGRRNSVAADANRICAWTEFRDRDGDLHYYGLNFQGQVLVNAVWEPTAKDFIVSEQLYNADGMLVQTRRPTRGTTPWTVMAGYTAFTYEELDPRDKDGWNDWVPVYWSRRTNLVHEETIAAGGGILDEPEPPGPPLKSLGRYKKFRYEPFFSQINYEETGTLREKSVASSGDRISEEVPLSRITTVFDYQELDWDDHGRSGHEPSSIKSLLDRFRQWGFGWMIYKDDYDYKNISGWQLPVKFYNDDLNGDGEKGFPYRTLANGRAVGLPIVIQVQPEGISAGFETTVISYGPNGRPALLETPSGQRYQFSYYALAKSGFSSYGNSERPKANEVSSGFGGFLAKVDTQRLTGAQYDVTEGPTTKPCPYLSGPYQWVLPENCSKDVKSDLAKLGLQPDFVENIAQSTNSSSAEAWISTSLSYSEIGKPRFVWDQRGSTQYTLDVDGRVQKAIDPVGNRTQIGYSLEGNPTVIGMFDPQGKVTNVTVQAFDEENHLIYRCEALSHGGCDRITNHGRLPQLSDPVKDGVVNQFSYYPEGALKGSIDPEGLCVELVRNERKLVIHRRQEHPCAGATMTRSTFFDYTIDGSQKAIFYGVRPGSGGGGPQLSEHYEYDGLQRVIRHTDVRGSNRHWAYTNRDEVARTKQSQQQYYAGGATKPLWETTYRYDAYGRVIEVQDNEVTTARYRRGKGGRIFGWSADGLGETFMTYDGLGSVVWSVDSDGSQTLVGQQLNPDRAFWAQVRRNKTGQQLTTGRTTDFDQLGLPISETEFGNAFKRTWSTIRDTNGYVLARVNPDGARTEYQRNLLGWPKRISQLTVLGPPQVFDHTQLTHNKRGQLLTLADPAQQITQWIYTGFGELTEVNIPGQSPIKRSYTYDALGRLHTEIRGEYELSYQYDKRGDLFEIDYRRSVGDPFRMLLRLRFDELGRNVESVYDNVLLTDVPPRERLVNRRTSYDNLGRVELDLVSIGNQRHESRSAWQLIANNWSRRLDGGALEEGYDRLGRLESITRTSVGGRQVKISFDWLNELYVGRTQEQVGRPSPFREIRELGPFGELSKLLYTAIDETGLGEPKDKSEGNGYCGGKWNATYCGDPLLSIEIQRDVAGRIVSLASRFGFPILKGGSLVTKRHPQTWHGYAYNPLGQLLQLWEHYSNSLPSDLGGLPLTGVAADELAQAANLSGANHVLYTRERNVGGTTKIAESNTGAIRWELANPRGPGHQLQNVKVDGQTLNIKHDLMGQVRFDGKRELEFDPLGRLARVKDRSSSQSEQYAYDDKGRLIAVFIGNVLRPDETFQYDRRQMVASFNASGQKQWAAIWGPGVNQLLAWDDKLGHTGEHIPLIDHRKSLVATWQTKAAEITQTAEYNPEGRVVLNDQGNAVCTEPGTGKVCSLPGSIPFGFTSAWRSKSTGLTFLQNRWYSPELGQFLSHDQRMGFDSLNLYSYAAFDAINLWDPFGLKPNQFSHHQGQTPAPRRPSSNPQNSRLPDHATGPQKPIRWPPLNDVATGPQMPDPNYRPGKPWTRPRPGNKLIKTNLLLQAIYSIAEGINATVEENEAREAKWNATLEWYLPGPSGLPQQEPCNAPCSVVPMGDPSTSLSVFLPSRSNSPMILPDTGPSGSIYVGARDRFMEISRKKIVSTPGHPLEKLINPATNNWWSRHKYSRNPNVQAGHLTSKHILPTLGAPERLAIEDATWNQNDSNIVETHGGWVEKSAIEIEGVTVELRTAETWVKAGILSPEDFARAASSAGWVP